MRNQLNVVKFFETFARIISEREGVHVTVHVRLKDTQIRTFRTGNSDNTVRYRRVRKTNQDAA